MITLANYEEYFLLYVDDELNAAEKQAVEEFTALYPHLRAELDLLLGTRLPALPLALDNKQVLLADQMKLNAAEESLLLYIDDELPGEEKAGIERQIHTDPAFQLQHQLLLRTKLDPTEKIIYPYKEELYHTSGKRILPYWLRIAAAVVIVTGAGLLVRFAGVAPGHPDTGTVALKQDRPVQQVPAIPENTPDGTPQAGEHPAAAREYGAPAPKTVILAARKQPSAPTTRMRKAGTTDAPDSQLAMAEAAPVGKKATVALSVQEEAARKIALQPAINNIAVTSAAVPAYIPQTPASLPVVPTANEVADNKSGTLKGFLRKATRFIERTTNIDPVNEDDELLIGAIAIKVK